MQGVQKPDDDPHHGRPHCAVQRALPEAEAGEAGDVKLHVRLDARAPRQLQAAGVAARVRHGWVHQHQRVVGVRGRGEVAVASEAVPLAARVVDPGEVPGGQPLHRDRVQERVVVVVVVGGGGGGGDCGGVCPALGLQQHHFRHAGVPGGGSDTLDVEVGRLDQKAERHSVLLHVVDRVPVCWQSSGVVRVTGDGARSNDDGQETGPHDTLRQGGRHGGCHRLPAVLLVSR